MDDEEVDRQNKEDPKVPPAEPGIEVIRIENS
jgi:hypothetical protein